MTTFSFTANKAGNPPTEDEIPIEVLIEMAAEHGLQVSLDKDHFLRDRVFGALDKAGVFYRMRKAGLLSFRTHGLSGLFCAQCGTDPCAVLFPDGIVEDSSTCPEWLRG